MTLEQAILDWFENDGGVWGEFLDLAAACETYEKLATWLEEMFVNPESAIAQMILEDVDDCEKTNWLAVAETIKKAQMSDPNCGAYDF